MPDVDLFMVEWRTMQQIMKWNSDVHSKAEKIAHLEDRAYHHKELMKELRASDGMKANAADGGQGT